MGAQEDRVGDGKDRGVGANAEREGKHRHQSESWVGGERTETESYVLPEFP